MFSAYFPPFDQTRRPSFAHTNSSESQKLVGHAQNEDTKNFFAPRIDGISSDTSSDTSPGTSPGPSPKAIPQNSKILDETILDDSYNLDTGIRYRKPRANSASSDSSESTY